VELTKQQQVTLRKKGGAAVLKKIKALGKKIDKGSASDKDQTQFSRLMDRSLKLIDTKLEGTIDEQESPKVQPEAVGEEELAREYYDRRIANLKKFKIKESETHMFSRRLNRNIWVVSTDKQQLVRGKEDDEVWTIDEAILLAQKERSLSLKGEELTDSEYEAISVARKMLDGEVVV